METDNTINSEEAIVALKDLERKAEILRCLHASRVNYYKNLVNIVTYSTILISFLISILAIADPQILSLNDESHTIFIRLIAVAGIILFIISISDKIFELNRKLATNEEAVRILTDYIRKSHHCRHVEIRESSGESILEKVKSMKDSYSLVVRTLPYLNTSDEEFLRVKKKYLIKVNLSTELDKDPYFDIEQGIAKLKK